MTPAPDREPRQIRIAKRVLEFLAELPPNPRDWREDMWHELVGSSICAIVEDENAKR